MGDYKNTERYIGYGNLLDLPSGRVGLQLTLNQLEELYKEVKEKGGGNPIKILVLPVKPENVTSWRTHSVKVGESKYKEELIKEH
jgi:hypothetical protein